MLDVSIMNVAAGRAFGFVLLEAELLQDFLLNDARLCQGLAAHGTRPLAGSERRLLLQNRQSIFEGFHVLRETYKGLPKWRLLDQPRDIINGQVGHNQLTSFGAAGSHSFNGTATRELVPSDVGLALIRRSWHACLVPLRSFLAACRERRAGVERDASELLTFLGDIAYSEARSRARGCRGKRDRAGDRHWSRVAVEIAKRTGLVIGETTTDRYEAGAQLTARQRADRAEVVAGLVDIAHDIADLTLGRGNATTLHNIRARVFRLAEIGASSTADREGEALCRACEALAMMPAETRRPWPAASTLPLPRLPGQRCNGLG